MNKGKLLVIIGLVMVLGLSLALGGLALARSSDDEKTTISLGSNTTPGSGEFTTLQVRNEQQTQLSVSGTGKVTARPDIAVVNLGVEVDDQTVLAAQQKASEAMSKIMLSLSDNGIAEKDIKTVDFSIVPIWNYDYSSSSSYIPDYQGTLKSYRVKNMLSVTIRDTAKVGIIIDTATEAAGDPTRVENIYFTVENTTQLYDQARELAIKDAMTKAQKTADLAKVKLGNIINISENSSYNSSVPSTIPYGVAYSLSSVAPTTISSGEFEINTSIQIVYTIEY